ncbi:MAG: hypothetical protein II321_02690 [Lachnospiraceae bacterium]|nr:hypothetical protein [Lachnospiraceae bacterium]
MVQKYPLLLSIYKGEGRILLIPIIDHRGGYSVDSDWFINLKNIEDYVEIGEGIFKSIDFVKESPISKVTSKERDLKAAWRKNSKYKSWISFWKNNNHAFYKLYEDGHYEVYSTKRTVDRKGGYGGCIKKVNLPKEATVEEIGKAVIEVFEAAEEYYHQSPAYALYPKKKLELLDGSTLVVKHPKEKHFVDHEDSGAAEIYQCYSYLPKEDGESSAEFFVGIAPELDCNLDVQNIKSRWEEVYGKAEFFEVQEVEYGLFKLRVEMRNKVTHKISYLLQMEEDLLLECGMDVHQPNRRKKLDENLSALFEEFTLECKR